ncbi:MAG: Phosphoenolpyruvate synthase, partial [Candidatus Levybacteria bacterium GW2011_GWA2_36_13]
VSIGTNDLTMLLLGTDRDNSEVAKEFDERNEAVLWALEKIIKTCHKHNVTVSICGQSVSTYSEILEKVVKWGITSVSVSPDVVNDVRKTIQKIEEEIIK